MKKNILITGSTDGIGKLVATRLAEEGHNVCVHGRSAEKVEAVVTELKTQAKNENIKGFVADFSDLDAVKKMSTQILEQVDHLDILINNAGVFKSPVAKTKEGYDLRMVVNYLAPYLLTRELMPLLEKGKQTRVVNLSSAAQAPVALEVILGQQEVSINESYAQSKLALTMWSFDLAKKKKRIAVIAVNPGSLLNTKMANEAYGQHWSPAEKGSDILYDLAVKEIHRGVTGKYFDNDNGLYALAHPDAYNEGLIEQLMTQTEALVKR